MSREALDHAIEAIHLEEFYRNRLELQVTFREPWLISQSAQEADVMVVTFKDNLKFVDKWEYQALQQLWIEIVIPP